MLKLLFSFEVLFFSEKGLWKGKKKVFTKIAHFLFLQSLAQQICLQTMGNLPNCWDLIGISMTTGNNGLCTQLQECRGVIPRLLLCWALHNSITWLILTVRKQTCQDHKRQIAFTFSSLSYLGSAAPTSVSDNKKLVFLTKAGKHYAEATQELAC